MKNFTMISQDIPQAFKDRKLPLTQMLVLIWIHLNTNPYNGKCYIRYKSLVETFKPYIRTQENVRQIVRSLRKNNWIWFENHRGKGGNFNVHPHKFKMQDGTVQIIEPCGGVQYATDDNEDISLYPNRPAANSQLPENNHNLPALMPPQILYKPATEQPASHNPLDTDSDGDKYQDTLNQ